MFSDCPAEPMPPAEAVRVMLLPSTTAAVVEALSDAKIDSAARSVTSPVSDLIKFTGRSRSAPEIQMLPEAVAVTEPVSAASTST